LRKNRTVPYFTILAGLAFMALLSENQVGFDKFVDISIEDSIRIAGFVLCSHIFNHLVGMENIGADLVSPANIRF